MKNTTRAASVCSSHSPSGHLAEHNSCSQCLQLTQSIRSSCRTQLVQPVSAAHTVNPVILQNTTRAASAAAHTVHPVILQNTTCAASVCSSHCSSSHLPLLITRSFPRTHGTCFQNILLSLVYEYLFLLVFYLFLHLLNA